MIPGDLGAGLREIASRRAGRAVTRATPAVATPAPVQLGDNGHGDAGTLPGAELRDIAGVPTFLVRRDVADLYPEIDLAAQLRAALADLARRDPDDVDRGLRDAAGCTLADLAVLDLETLGFWGCPIFLVGLLLEEDGRLVTLQLLARDYPEEASILRAAAHLLDGRRLLVTFNGKSYDVPCFRERAVVHRVPERIARLRHVDVLHPARRRFRTELPDCRLQTLEREVVGIFRTGDVPSWEVPAVYHEFAATGRAESLAPVLHHSRVDLLTTARLIVELARGEIDAS